jgi:tRNA/rRNA methyltransferase
VRFVLVAPSHPGNIGAAARAVKTMGFGRLAVVAPRDPAFRSNAEATALAVGAADVLMAATTHADLSEALTGVARAYAMTGYAREFGPPLLDLRSAARDARSALTAAPADVAFVFGTERAGLRNEDVERCHVCCAIPSNPDFDSLNLAQAVQVAAYEMRLALVGASADEGTEVADRFGDKREVPAPLEQVEAFYAHLERALIAVGYLDPHQPRRLMSRLRRLFGRAGMTASEVDILRGILAAIELPKADRAGRKVK